MTKGQKRAQEILTRILMPDSEIASRAGISEADVQAARSGQADSRTVQALDSLDDDLARRWAQNNR